MPFDEKTRKLLLEALSLKNLPRTGWVIAKAPNESVAEHTFGTAIIALALARMEKLKAKDEASLVRLAILHDLHEARMGDLTPEQKRMRKSEQDFLRSGMSKASSTQKTKPDEAKVEREMLKGTVLQKELALLQKKTGKLAVLSKDADKLDMLFRAMENQKKGNGNMKQFITFALKQIKSKSGKELAKLALG